MSALTPTANLQLFKANPGTGEAFRTSDVNSNWDKVDAALLPPPVDVVQATVNNTATETTVFTGQIGGPALQGSAWELDLGGIYANAASATTITIRIKLGGGTVATYTINTPASAFSNKAWRVSGKLYTVTTGAGGTWKLTGWAMATIGTTETPAMVTGTGTANTASPQNVDVTAQWGSANASNTFSCDAGIIRRLTNA
jgi:hypothetical protein